MYHITTRYEPMREALIPLYIVDTATLPRQYTRQQGVPIVGRQVMCRRVIPTMCSLALGRPRQVGRWVYIDRRPPAPP